MNVSSLNVKEIAKLGIDIEITEKGGYSSLNVKEIIKIIVKNKKHITIHTSSYSSLNLKEFAKLGKDYITIVF